MKKLWPPLIFTFLLISAACTPKFPEKPNIVFILADDLGYGDLSCYGQTLFTTPNLDQMAADGMRFTQHYAGCTVCAPSRSSLMTGLHTGHTPIRGNKEMDPEGQWPLPDSVITLAEVLQEAGYTTGAFGKWGLGFVGTEGDPNNQGFHEFFGYNCQRIAHNYYPYYLWQNSEKILLEGNADSLEGQYAPELIHEKALEFIEKHKDERFFLYYASPLPHAELKVPDPYMDPFRGKFLPEKSYTGTDSGPNYKMGGYGSQPESHAAFVGMVTYLDQSVGEVLDKLEELGLTEKTLVLFSSDNGPHLEGGADPNYFNSNGIFKGFKRDLYEGGIRVPLIVRWPGQIRAGSVSDQVGAFWDLFPSFAALAGSECPDYIDGISLIPTFLEKGNQQQPEYLYWEFHEAKGRVAIRKGDWKALRRNLNEHPDSPLELYDLKTDPGEEHNVAAAYPDLVQELDSLIRIARFPSKEYPQKGLDRR